MRKIKRVTSYRPPRPNNDTKTPNIAVINQINKVPMPDCKQSKKDNVDVMYECDRRACSVCVSNCTHTLDISHANNFEKEGRYFVEKK